MPGKQTLSEFRAAFKRRTALAREARGYTQEQLAELLNTTQGSYQKYEGRSLLPHHLVERFCLLCGIDSNWLLTGKGRAPTQVAPVDADAATPLRRRGRPRKAA